MARTSPASVKAVLLTDYNSAANPDLAAFIDTASAIVDRVVTCAASRGFALSATEAELIERWLAAHAYHCSDPTYTSRSTLGASGSFFGQGAMGLDGSRYGQMAKGIDPSGCLASMGKRVGMVWLGKNAPDQIPYADR